MPLTKLQFRPGINRETTSYTNEGGWFDMDKVRFRFGYPEKIGGWIKQSSNAFAGTCRALHPWVALDGTSFLGVGTHLKYYVNEGGGYSDITPIRNTTSAGDVTFSASANTLSAAVAIIDTTISLTSASGFPESGRIKINSEIITYAAVSGNNLTGCVRGVGGTTPAAHSSSDAVTCATLVVTDNNHGALENDFVTFSGAATLGDAITADILNQEYQITAIVNDNSYQIEARTVSTIGSITTTSGLDPTYVFATSSDSGNGGSSVVGEYQINTGLDTTIVGNGWGAGTWSRGAWGSSTSLTASGQTLRIWSHDNFGEDLIINVRDSAIYYWDRTSGTTNRAVKLNTTGSIVAATASGTSTGSATFTGVTQDSTSGSGSGAEFIIEAVGGVYNIISIVGGGVNYNVSDTITILGTNLGGATPTNDLTITADQLDSYAGAPTVAKQVLVSDRDRHVIAFGCDSETNPGIQDPLLIRFSDQENIADWGANVQNTAGDLRIGSGSEIVTAIETRQQILVFTDVSLHAMQFLGPPFTFGINAISENITIAGPLAAINVEDNVFWMGAEEFYVYGGAVQRLPCSVRDYVFTDINNDQLEKVTASTNTAFSEVTWFYPSASSSENDRYVTYNYQQKVWYFGNLARTVWLDRGVSSDPIAAGTDHYLYLHEIGFDDGSTSPASAISAYIESSQMDLGEGEQFVFMRRLIPDLTFRNSTAVTPSATMTLKVRNFPGGNYLSSDANTVSKTASVPIEQFTDQVFVRLRGRSFAFRIESADEGVTWRLGSPRVEVRPDGRR
jgi:hypothetical protein